MRRTGGEVSEHLRLVILQCALGRFAHARVRVLSIQLMGQYAVSRCDSRLTTGLSAKYGKFIFLSVQAFFVSAWVVLCVHVADGVVFEILAELGPSALGRLPGPSETLERTTRLTLFVYCSSGP